MTRQRIGFAPLHPNTLWYLLHHAVCISQIERAGVRHLSTNSQAAWNMLADHCTTDIPLREVP